MSIGGIIMARKICPCCENYTIDCEEEIIVDICEVYFWQYDIIAHNKPELNIVANDISLNEARENYKKYSACKKEFADKELVRKLLTDELPVNN